MHRQLDARYFYELTILHFLIIDANTSLDSSALPLVRFSITIVFVNFLLMVSDRLSLKFTFPLPIVLWSSIMPLVSTAWKWIGSDISDRSVFLPVLISWCAVSIPRITLMKFPFP